MKKLLLLSALLIAFSACKRQNMIRTANTRSLGKSDPTAKPYSVLPPAHTAAPAGDQPATPSLGAGETAVQQETIYRYLVSFYSEASGPDNEGMRAFDEWVANFGISHNKTLNYQKNSWGREGETEYCFPLSELTAAEQAEFVAGANEQLKKAQRVHTYENQPAKHRKKP